MLKSSHPLNSLNLIDLTHTHAPIVDNRGSILDLAFNTQISAVTQIFSSAKSQRANHYHNKTEQYNYVAYGSVVLATRPDFDTQITYTQFSAQSFFLIEKKEHHALYFLEDTLMLVLTIGPRCGKEYESDTVRLQSSLFTVS